MLVSVQELITYMDIRFSLRQQDAAELILAGLQSELESYLRRPIEVTEFTEEYKVPANNLAMPMSSFFYQQNLESSFYAGQGNTSRSVTNYAMPPETVYLRNSPVSKVLSVSIQNQWTTPTYLGEAIKRTATVTGATKVGNKVTFTSNGHKLTVGQYVTIKNADPIGYNVINKKIVEVTANSFVIDGVTESIGAYVSGGNAEAVGTNYTVRRYGVDVYNMVADDVITINYEAGLDGDTVPVFKLLILRAATREMQNMHDDVVGVKDLNPRGVAPMETGFTDRELASVKKYKRVRVA
jgi:hypothetical protein